MKALKRLLVAIFFTCSIGANAQITLQNSFPTSSFPNSFIDWVYLKHSGFKSLYIHSDTLDVYNTNNSLYKTILIPPGYSPGNFNITYVSEGLFDTDSLHIDYMIRAFSGDSLLIYKDNGAKVFMLDSANLGTVGLGMGSYYPASPIFNTDSGTFMIVEKPANGAFINGEQIYKLPGSLPCVPGCSNSVTITSTGPSPGSNNSYSNVYPNPAISYTNIFYSLPQGTNEGEVILYDLAGREIKQFNVTSQFDHLRITTSDIKAGTYFYQLIAGGKNISTKKIVVVK